MNFYKTKKWKDKRKVIFKRDKYLCLECKKYGRDTEADTVHHVFPFESYPEYALNNYNLISLCSKCHNKMHERETHLISQLGREWQKKQASLILKTK